MKLLFIISLFSVFFSAQTTPYSFNLDRVSGLPSETVYDIFQDDQSFVWFATSQGICRYDGLQIKTYLSERVLVKSVSHISQDLQGRIWFQDFNGKIFYIENEKVHLFPKDKANGFLRYAIIGGQLFVAGKHAVKVYRLSDFELVKTIHTDMKLFKHSISDQKKLLSYRRKNTKYKCTRRFERGEASC